MELKKPESKKFKRTYIHYKCPLPVLETQSNYLLDDEYWPSFTGYFNGSCIIIDDPEEMLTLYAKGFFGKGFLTKGPPSYFEENNIEIITERQWKRRQEWRKTSISNHIEESSTDSLVLNNKVPPLSDTVIVCNNLLPLKKSMENVNANEGEAADHEYVADEKKYQLITEDRFLPTDNYDRLKRIQEDSLFVKEDKSKKNKSEVKNMENDISKKEKIGLDTEIDEDNRNKTFEDKEIIKETGFHEKQGDEMEIDRSEEIMDFEPMQVDSLEQDKQNDKMEIDDVLKESLNIKVVDSKMEIEDIQEQLETEKVVVLLADNKIHKDVNNCNVQNEVDGQVPVTTDNDKEVEQNIELEKEEKELNENKKDANSEKISPRTKETNKDIYIENITKEVSNRNKSISISNQNITGSETVFPNDTINLDKENNGNASLSFSIEISEKSANETYNVKEIKTKIQDSDLIIDVNVLETNNSTDLTNPLDVEKKSVHLKEVFLETDSKNNPSEKSVQIKPMYSSVDTDEVLVIADIENDLSEDVMEQLKPHIEKGSMKNIIHVMYISLEEAFFLCFALNCLNIIGLNGKCLDINELWHLFQEAQEDFLSKYVAYHYFRAKGWVVKSGEKYAGDFVLYKKGPQFYHSSYVVYVIPNTEKVPDDILFRKKPKPTWNLIMAHNRLVETARKELLLLYVYFPKLTKEKLKDPSILKEFKVRECLVRRWLPSVIENIDS